MRPVWLPLSILCKRNPDHDKTLPEARHRGLPVHPDRLPPSKAKIRQMHQSVSTLSQEMTQLNQQTIKSPSKTR
ncbi:lipoprotein yajI [Klebsiella pneumoniae]|uniref:Lipoprotein yajI n=1 Tax=Klebsiella pneumoniae TaxID=573 RepID=A0A377TR79_KLEPN|nr:lipoprotein yajI [Klebsiella pneumoniae]